jgi:hypothetical protein
MVTALAEKVTALAVLRVLTGSGVEPLPDVCTGEPGYDALMLCVPVPLVLGVTVTWQVETPVLVCASVQVPAMVSPESELTVTVPVGVSAVPLLSESVTVTVAVLVWFTSTELGVRATTVVVERVLTVSAAEPLLAVCTVEPG